jgi:hypothetical protein
MALFTRLMLSVLFILLFIPAVSFGEPIIRSVTGSFTHRESVVITGANFGPKETAAPVAWDDFEDGLADTKPTVGTWERIEGLWIDGTAEDRRHPKSRYQGKYNFGGGTAGFGGGQNQYGKWYGDYWLKLDPRWRWGSTLGSHLANVKIFRIWCKGDCRDNTATVIHTFDQPGNLWTIQEACSGTSRGWGGVRGGLTPGAWHHLQFEYQESSSRGRADGIMRVQVDGKLVDAITNLITRCAASDTPKRVSLLGFYNSWGSYPVFSYWQDDSYIDRTWARVELGDSPTYTSCRHREIQVPLAWSHDAITITVNEGAFEDGQPAYLFVVDQEGVPNQVGYPITISPAASPLRELPAPTDLQVIPLPR